MDGPLRHRDDCQRVRVAGMAGGVARIAHFTVAVEILDFLNGQSVQLPTFLPPTFKNSNYRLPVYLSWKSVISSGLRETRGYLEGLGNVEM